MVRQRQGGQKSSKIRAMVKCCLLDPLGNQPSCRTNRKSSRRETWTVAKLTTRASMEKYYSAKTMHRTALTVMQRWKTCSLEDSFFTENLPASAHLTKGKNPRALTHNFQTVRRIGRREVPPESGRRVCRVSAAGARSPLSSGTVPDKCKMVHRSPTDVHLSKSLKPSDENKN